MRLAMTRMGAAVAMVAALLGVISLGVSGAAAPRGQTPPQCSPDQVAILASTNHGAYPPGRTVTMTSSITNVSSASCTIYLGYDPGFSPSFTVTNSGGTVVWDRCWLNDEPGACSTTLKGYTLRPGKRFHQKATWDQKSGPDGGPVVQVPQGQYTFTTVYQYIGTASTTFDIVVA